MFVGGEPTIFSREVRMGGMLCLRVVVSTHLRQGPSLAEQVGRARLSEVKLVVCLRHELLLKLNIVPLAINLLQALSLKEIVRRQIIWLRVLRLGVQLFLEDHFLDVHHVDEVLALALSLVPSVAAVAFYL